MKTNSKAKRIRRVLLALAAAAGSGGLLLAVYARFGVGIPCVFYQITGLYCPGCGGMRAVWALKHGDAAGALGYNALLVVLLPVLLLCLLGSVVGYLRHGTFRLGDGRLDRLFWWVLVACAVFGIARNLPPLSFLAP